MTTIENTEDMRPRMRSGVTVWLIVERATALTESAAPATASSSAATHSERASPTTAIALPQTITAQITTIPRRRVLRSQPVVSAPTVAPADTDACRTPVPAAPAPKVLTESTANSARGLRPERRTGLEPATYGLGSHRSTS